MRPVPSIMWAVSLSLIMISSGFVIVGSGSPEPIEFPEPLSADQPPETQALFNPWPTYTGYTVYHTVEEMETELFQAASDHPDIMTLQSIGKTWQDRDIWAIKISDNPEIEEPDEPEIYFNANHHAREWLTIEIALYAIHFLTDNYGTNATVTDIVDNRQVWILPCINPDGRVFDGDVKGDEPGEFHPGLWGYGWRKNCADNNGDEVFNYLEDGVDLNRNYGYLWGSAGATSDPTEETYGGPAPFSELESQAVKRFTRQHDFVYAVSYHTYSQLILYPWGWTYEKAPDHDALLGVANAMFGRITNLADSEFPGYTPDKSSGLYPTAGCDDDWLYGELGIYAYCVEAFPNVQDDDSSLYASYDAVTSPYNLFHPREDKVLPACQDNIGAIILLCQAADNKFQFIDHVSSEPVEAEFRIEDDTSDSITINITDDGLRADDFDITYTTIPGWTINLSPGTMSLARNETQAAVLDVTVPFEQTPGTYTIWVNTSSQTNASCTDSSKIIINVPWPDDAAAKAIAPFTERGEFPAGMYRIDGTVENAGEIQIQEFNTTLTITQIGVGSTVTLFEDDMESGMGKWNIIDHDLAMSASVWHDVTDRSASSSHSLWCGPIGGGDYTSSTIQTLEMAQTLDLQEYVTVTLEFMSYYYTETFYDFLMVEGSPDNGATWDYITRYDGIDPSWQLQTLNLSEYLGADEFKLRFRFTSDSWTEEIGFWLDDVKITAEDPNESIIYGPAKLSTSGPLDVGALETLSWAYTFPAGTYRASIETLYKNDSNPANNVSDVIFYINGSRTLPEFDGIASVSNPGMSTSLKVSWEPALQVNEPITYEVHRFDHSPTEIEVNASSARWSGTDMSWTDTGTPGLTYYYVVRAEDDLGQAEYNMVVKSGVPNILTVEHWGPADMATSETRFMRGIASEMDANGLAAYYLGSDQSSTAVQGALTGNRGTVSTGFRVWVRDSAGTEVELTGNQAEAIVTRSANGEGIQTTTWDCQSRALNTDDSIVIRVYQSLISIPIDLKAEFTTEALGATNLDESTWSVSYYTSRGTNNDYFRWGSGDYNSRIENFKWSLSSNPADHNTLNWSVNSDIQTYRIYRSDVESGPWDPAHIIDTVSGISDTYVDINKGLADSTLWWYVIRSVDEFGVEDTNTIAIQEPSEVIPTPYDIPIPAGPDDWVFVSFPYAMSGAIEVVLDDSDITSGTGTQWDIAKWYDASDKSDPWKTYNKNNPAGLNDLTTIDNTMGIWLHLTASDGTLSTGTLGAYSSIAVNIDLYTGWNLVGFPTANNEFANAALLGTGATWIATWQLTSPFIADTTDLPNTPMIEGEAYWVYVSADTTWIVDQ